MHDSLPLETDSRLAVLHARRLAAERGDHMLRLEHLLAALLELPQCGELAARLSADPDSLLHDVREALPRRRDGGARQDVLLTSPSVERSLERAQLAAAALRHDLIAPAHLLLGVAGESHGAALEVLAAHGLTRDRLRKEVAIEAAVAAEPPTGLRDPARPGAARGTGSAKPAGETPATEDDRATGGKSAASGRTETAAAQAGDKPGALDAYCADLVAKARAGGLEPVVGREAEIAKTLRILARRNKRNPLLVGEPGIGKTAIVEGIAQRIADGAVPEQVAGLRILTVDLGAMVAGTRYRGDFEERLKALLAEAKADPSVVLFIDEIHTLMGAGAAGGGAMDAANIMKPALSRDELRCMGATTLDEYRKHVESDRAMARRFRLVELREPTPAEARAMLEGARGATAAHHGVVIGDEALEAAIELTVRLLPNLRLPDKAKDALDEAAALARLAGRGELGRSDVETVVREMARLETGRRDPAGSELIRTLPPAVAEAVEGFAALAAADLERAGRPTASLLLEGAETAFAAELAERLGRDLGRKAVVVDLAACAERHGARQLTGAPGEPGTLTGPLDGDPRALILLANVDQAHPEAQDTVRRLLRHGRVRCSATGRDLDAGHACMLLTAAPPPARMAYGFSAEPPSAGEGALPPALRAAIDRTVVVEPCPDLRRRRLDAMLEDFMSSLARRRVTLRLTEAARALLAEAAVGDADLDRTLQRLVREPLARRLSRGGEGPFVLDLDEEREDATRILPEREG